MSLNLLNLGLIAEFRLKFQPTYKYNDSEPIAANYYPVNSRITIKVNTLKNFAFIRLYVNCVLIFRIMIKR